jgi:hypothetical protein
MCTFQWDGLLGSESELHDGRVGLLFELYILISITFSCVLQLFTTIS